VEGECSGRRRNEGGRNPKYDDEGGGRGEGTT
jgi:hypothetical protein